MQCIASGILSRQTRYGRKVEVGVNVLRNRAFQEGSSSLLVDAKKGGEAAIISAPPDGATDPPLCRVWRLVGAAAGSTEQSTSARGEAA